MPDVRVERAELAAAMADVLAAIRDYGSELLNHANVVAIKPGFRFVAGRITSEPAILVQVDRKIDATQLSTGILPKQIGGVPVDVIEANPMVQHRLQRSQALAGPGSTPEPWQMSTALPGEEQSEEEAFLALGGPLLPYRPPGVPASEVDEVMTVTCYSSCDTGSRLLTEFFSRTQSTLMSTMYEFTARHLLDRLLASLAKPREFKFIFDGKKKKLGKDDLTRQQVVTELRTNLGNRLELIWAANAQATEVVSAGFFPMAYHIKVSVRDGKEVWLSSGNWKESNQPEIDPQHAPAAFDAEDFEADHNREWHVLIENTELARQFARYIRHDMDEAKPLQLDKQAPQPDDVMPDVFEPVSEKKKLAGPPTFYPELVIRNRKMRVLPLFTPDANSYFDNVARLVAGAKKKILFENQSLSPKASDTQYMNKLFLVLRDQALKPDVEVYIVLRSDYGPDEILTNLKAYKFPMEKVRLLSNVHTKGIIIDDELVVVGSQNWTGQGTHENRDASLVFRDPDIVAFYTKLFWYDWERAEDRLGPMPRIAPAGAPTPAGYRRRRWNNGG